MRTWGFCLFYIQYGWKLEKASKTFQGTVCVHGLTKYKQSEKWIVPYNH